MSSRYQCVKLYFQMIRSQRNKFYITSPWGQERIRNIAEQVIVEAPKLKFKILLKVAKILCRGQNNFAKLLNETNFTRTTDLLS